MAAASQRDRLLAAMADACVARGYAHVTVGDVVAKAGVSRRTFYEHFANLEECVLATYDRGVEALAGLLAERVAHQAPDARWQDRLRDVLAAYLEVLAEDPAFTQFAMIELLGAGPAARSRYLAAVERFHRLLRELDTIAGARQRRRVPSSDVALAMIGGGLYRLVMTEVLAGRVDRLPEHLDELQRFCVRALSTG